MSRFNKPLGMRVQHFSPEARLVLRLGHKFALERRLRPTLSMLTEATKTVFEKNFKALRTIEERNELELWANAMDRDIQKIYEPRPQKLELLIAKGIRDLAKLPVILKQADKNLGLVPIHKHVYNMMCKEHLNDNRTYRRVRTFPINLIRDRVRKVLQYGPIPRWRKNLWLHSCADADRAAPFYVIPKIHKKKLFASRPIAAQHSYILAPLSKELSNVLLEAQLILPTISKDSKTTARELNEFKFSRPGLFLTYDVVAMYPNIDISDAITILEQNVPVLKQHHGFWANVLRLVMHHSYVEFNNEIYHQVQGTAMGTPVAPPFANLYFYYRYRHILENESILFQRRFIDDGFVIIKSRNAALDLMEKMKKVGKLEFTYEISDTRAVYLDFEIYKGPRYTSDMKLDLKPYFKPTNQFLYLPAKSNHPEHMKLAIVKGEAIRCLRNSTSKNEWLHALHTIFKGLIARGYDGRAIKAKFRQVRWEHRETYLQASVKCDSRPEGKLALTHYHRMTKPIWRSLIRKHSLPRRLRLTRRRYNNAQNAIIDAWPPVVVFKEFFKIGHRVIRARQTENSE